MESHGVSAQFDRLLHLLEEIATLARLRTASAEFAWVAFCPAAFGLMESVPLPAAGRLKAARTLLGLVRRSRPSHASKIPVAGTPHSVRKRLGLVVVFAVREHFAFS
jgi:hypothetical protein